MTRLKQRRPRAAPSGPLQGKERLPIPNANNRPTLTASTTMGIVECRFYQCMGCGERVPPGDNLPLGFDLVAGNFDRRSFLTADGSIDHACKGRAD